MEEKQARLKQINSVLSKLTNGKTVNEKKDYLKDLGFASYSQLEACDEGTLSILLSKLETALKSDYITHDKLNGYNCSHPKHKPYTAAQVSWEFKNKPKSFKEKYG